MTEAEKEVREAAEREYPHRDVFLEGGAYMAEERSRVPLREAFVAGAQWQASRAPQPTDDDRGVPGFAEREKRAARAWEFFTHSDREMSHDFRGGYHQGLIDGWAPASGRGYADAIADLRWLADARDQYGSEDAKHGVTTARLLAKILAETTPVSDGGTGFGWLPSWLWDEWDARKRRRGAPAEPAVTEAMVEAAAVAAYRAGAGRYVNMVALGHWMRAALPAALSTERGE